MNEAIINDYEIKVSLQTVSHPWNVVHIFGSGKTQVVGREYHGIIENTEIETLPAFLIYISSLLKNETELTLDSINSVNIVNGEFINYSGKTRQERFKWDNINIEEVNILIDSIKGRLQINTFDTKMQEMASFMAQKKSEKIDK